MMWGWFRRVRSRGVLGVDGIRNDAEEMGEIIALKYTGCNQSHNRFSNLKNVQKIVVGLDGKRLVKWVV
jgi:hypothetical protein